MNEEERQVLRALSLYLHYPAETSPTPDFSGLTARSEKEALERFRAYRQGRALLRLQEEYTRTFDLNPPNSLNLTFHHPGANLRGKLLVRLRREYENAGYEILGGELPDYLPLLLEFLTVCPDDSRTRICAEYAGVASLLASRLAEAGSPYAGLMGVVKDTFAAHSPAL